MDNKCNKMSMWYNVRNNVRKWGRQGRMERARSVPGNKNQKIKNWDRYIK